MATDHPPRHSRDDGRVGINLRPIAVTAVINLAAISLCGVSRAEMPATRFLQLYQNASAADKTYLETLLGATYNGMEWIEAHLREEREICVPAGLVLTNKQLIEMIQKKATSDALAGQTPYGLTLLMTLKEAFPCNH